MWGGEDIGKTIEFVWKPQCTEHPLVYSWYPPTLIMVSLQCTHGISPVYSWYLPPLWTAPLYSWYLPHSSWYPSAVLMVSPTVLNTPGVLMILPVYCIPPVYCTDIMQGGFWLNKKKLENISHNAHKFAKFIFALILILQAYCRSWTAGTGVPTRINIFNDFQNWFLPQVEGKHYCAWKWNVSHSLNSRQ